MLHSDQPPNELGQFTGFLMAYLGSRSGRRFASALEPFGLHPRHFGVMTVLDKRAGLTQQDLADESNVDRSSMVAVLDELERRGLAERRSDPADRRKRAIHLTEEGRATLEKMQRVASKVGEENFARLSDDERATLHQLLRKLAGYAD
jgi:MarR family transcriptional regulator, lower aerobic nicotinate degradation pathway regulator